MRKRELAGHLQRTEAVEVGSYIDGTPAIARAAGAATKRIDGVICLATARVDEPFLNRALGFGTIADGTERLLDRIERHYAAVGWPTRVALATGCVAPSAVRLLERRGYAPVESSTELIYVYDRARPPAAPAVNRLVIEKVGPSQAKLYATTQFESFQDRGPEFRGIVEALVRSGRRGLHAYLGRVGGEPAATGMFFDVRPVGGLGNGTVRPEFRGRGLQTAMIAYRMREGWRRGFRIFFGQTQNPASAHNLDDLGWRKLYDEITWERKS